MFKILNTKFVRSAPVVAAIGELVQQE